MESRRNLNRLAYYVAIVEAGTITAAADRLGISKAVVSKQLQLLEEELGTVLLLRNTRRLQPSETGQIFYEQVKAVLLRADEAFDTITEVSGALRGRLRIAAPVDFGTSYIAPLISRFCAVNPAVEINLSLSDMRLDMIEQRCDLAFRMGELVNSSNLSHKLGSFSDIAVCSPKFLSKNKIAKPEDLQFQPFIANQALENPTSWSFRHGGRTSKVEMRPAFTTNNSMAIREAVIAGHCFAILPDFLVSKNIAAKQLVRLLPRWALRTGGIYVVSPPGRMKANVARTFLDLVYSKFRSYPLSHPSPDFDDGQVIAV